MKMKCMRRLMVSICLIIGQIQNGNAAEAQCCGGSPLPAQKKCCDDVQYDDNPQNPETASLDLSAIANIVSGAFDSLDCGLTLPGDNLTLSYTKESVELCCEGSVQTKYKYTGSVSISGMGIFCDIPLAGVPNVVEAGVTVAMSIGISGSVDNSPDCGDGDICFSLSAPVTITGGGYASALSGVIDVRIVGGGTGSGSFQYCIEQGFQTGSFCATPIAEFSFTFATFLTSSYSWTGDTYCNS